MSRAPSASALSRALRVGLVVVAPLALLAGGLWYAVRDASRVWPAVDTPAPESPPPAIPPCEDGADRLESLFRALDLEGEEGAAELHGTLDGLLACGGLDLAQGPLVRRASKRLEVVAERRLQRAGARAAAGDQVGAAEDLASTLRLGALAEHGGGALELHAAGLALSEAALVALESWMTEHHPLPEEALAPLADTLGALVQLPDGALDALVWECRTRETELQRLASIPAPAMLLEPAGVPLWAGWIAELLPGATVYDAPRTLAMHRQRCGLRLDAVRAGELWGDAELGPPLWDREQIGVGRLLDNPLGRVSLEQDDRVARIDTVLVAGRTLRSRRALVAARVALERGSLAHEGLLPLNLELLVPDFLSEAPVDPVDGQPIHWVRSHGEIFTTREALRPDGSSARLMTRVPER